MAISRFHLLHTGARMPSLGLGTYLATFESCQAAVDHAIGVGYRHIDTAYSYNNEAAIGEILKQKIKKQEIKRKDIFLTTKIPPVYLDPKDIEVATKESLEKLGVSFVDMLLIHAPWGLKNHGNGELKPKNSQGQHDLYHHDHIKAWKVFESLVDKGLTKAIGVSNFTAKQIDRIWDNARVKPANVQMECHLYHQQPELRAFCQEKNIVVTAYSPLGAPGRLDRHREKGDQNSADDKVVKSIAAKHSKTPAQIALRYLLEVGVVPLPKSVNPTRIQENVDCFSVKLDKEDITKLSALNKNQKYFRFHWAECHPEYYPGEPF